MTNRIARIFYLIISLLLPVSVLSEEVPINSFGHIAYAWMERGNYVYATTKNNDIYVFLCNGNRCSSGVLLIQDVGDLFLYDIIITDGALYFLVGDEYGGRLGSAGLKCMSVGDCRDHILWHDADGFRLVPDQKSRELYIEKDDGLYSVKRYGEDLSLGQLVEGTSHEFHDYAWYDGDLFFATYGDSPLGSSISVLNISSGKMDLCRVERRVKSLNVLSNRNLVFISSGGGFSREIKIGQCESDIEVLYSQKADELIENVKVSAEGEVLFQVSRGVQYKLMMLKEKVGK